MFETPSVRELAAYIDRTPGSGEAGDEACYETGIL